MVNFNLTYDQNPWINLPAFVYISEYPFTGPRQSGLLTILLFFCSHGPSFKTAIMQSHHNSVIMYSQTYAVFYFPTPGTPPVYRCYPFPLDLTQLQILMLCHGIKIFQALSDSLTVRFCTLNRVYNSTFTKICLIFTLHFSRPTACPIFRIS